MRSGRFLEPSRIAKPASDRNNPEYYAIPDFCIGAELSGRVHFLVKNKIFWSFRKSIRHHGSRFTREKLGKWERRVASIFICSKHPSFVDFLYAQNCKTIINYIFVQKKRAFYFKSFYSHNLSLLLFCTPSGGIDHKHRKLVKSTYNIFCDCGPVVFTWHWRLSRVQEGKIMKTFNQKQHLRTRVLSILSSNLGIRRKINPFG